MREVYSIIVVGFFNFPFFPTSSFLSQNLFLSLCVAHMKKVFLFLACPKSKPLLIVKGKMAAVGGVDLRAGSRLPIQTV